MTTNVSNSAIDQGHLALKGSLDQFSGTELWRQPSEPTLSMYPNRNQGQGHEQDPSQCCLQDNVRPSPLAIPEILLQICSYLQGLALVRACRVSKDFFDCCEPLLWKTIPESAWGNATFCENWSKHGCQIRSLRCGPGVDLNKVALFCHDLVSLDVSRVSAERTTKNSRPGGGTTKPDRIGIDSLSNTRTMTQSTISTLQIVAATVHTNQSQTNRTCQVDSNNNKNNLTAGADAASYESFVTMSDSLVQIIQTNKNLRCLQLKPQGRFPPRLLDSLSRLDRLEILSLDGWEDFQEYSLRLILAGCQQLSHLSLGKNDFTRFSLDTLTCPETSSYLHNAKTVIKLEPFDDPIKGTHGRHYVDPDSLDIQSMRAVRCLAAPSTNLPLGSPLQQSYRHDQHYHPLSTLATARQGQTVVSQSGIRSLSLHQSGLRQEFLVNLTRQCPQLEHLSLIDGWGFYPSSKFALNLAQCCPQLSRLEFREQALDLQDEFFVSLCRHFPRLQWIHAGQTGFSQRALESVGIFCRDIVSLNLDGTRGIHSKTMESILRTCPSLKAVRAQGVVLNGRDLDKDYPWVCVGLETLVIDIEIYVALQTLGSKEKESETTVKNVRTKVYCQLAALSRIQWLGLGGGHRVGGKDSGVDLTLESGLGLLSTLQCLERLDLRRLVQNLGEEDLAWMVQHWPRLQKVEVSQANRGTHKDRFNKALQWLAQARPGIEMSLYLFVPRQ